MYYKPAVIISFVTACCVTISAGVAQLTQLVLGDPGILDLVHLSVFGILALIAVGSQFRLSPFLTGALLLWILLGLPASAQFETGGRHNPALVLSGLILAALLLSRRGQVVRLADSRSGKAGVLTAVFFFWCFLISDILTSWLGAEPMLHALSEPRFSPFSEPISCVGSYVLLLVLAVRVLDWGFDWLSALAGGMISISLFVLARFLITNDPTFSFYRDFYPMATPGFDPKHFSLLYFVLTALLFGSAPAAGGEARPISNCRSLAQILAVIVAALSFDFRLYLALVVYACARAARQRSFGSKETLRISAYAVLGLTAVGALWLYWSVGLPRIVQKQWSDFTLFQGYQVQSWLILKSLAASPIWGLGPWFREITLETVKVDPQKIQLSALCEILSYGGALLIGPLGLLIARLALNGIRRLSPLGLGMAPFILNADIFSQTEALLCLACAGAGLDLTRGVPPPAADAPSPKRTASARWLGVSAALIALTGILFIALSTAVIFRAGKHEAQAALLAAENDIPETFVYALLLKEDGKFFMHRGLDFLGIYRSFKKNVSTKQFSEGASTISMQLAKLMFLPKEKTVLRKLRQTLLALLLERTFTKSEILKLYISRLDFGLDKPGLRYAARRYFDKESGELAIAESLQLVLTIPNPVIYNPAKAESPPVQEKLDELKRLLETEWFLVRDNVQRLEWTKKEPYYY